MMDDILSQLSVEADECIIIGMDEIADLLIKSRDTIAALRAEVEALKAEKRAAWEAGRNAAADVVQIMTPSYKGYDSGRDALNDAQEEIRALTPPEV